MLRRPDRIRTAMKLVWGAPALRWLEHAVRKRATLSGHSVCAVASGLLLALSSNPACATLLITEFMASNSNTLADEDGDYSDWLEIYNASTNGVDLDGWYLTDDSGNLAKWRCPGIQLLPGESVVVFASSKDRADPAHPHTNFKLSKYGEYLALVRPDAVTIAHEYPEPYPVQFSDVSYGIPQTVTTLLSQGDPARYHVPTPDDASLGLTWTDRLFDDSTWSVGSTGFGFTDEALSRFDVTVYEANVEIWSLATAESVIADPALQLGVTHATAATINFINTGANGHFSGDTPFPGTTIGVNVDEFVVLVTGRIFIPSPGEWTFGVHSDDGFGLTMIDGSTTFDFFWVSRRNPTDSLAVFDVPAAGTYEVRLVYFEGWSGATLEFFAAPGSFSSFSSVDFRLVGDVANGGLPVVGLGEAIGTDVQGAMQNTNASLWVRADFAAGDLADVEQLLLNVQYEDGFVAFLNGVEIAARHAPPALTWDAAATVDRSIDEALERETINITDYASLVTAGTNSLAVQALNDTASNGEFLMLPGISAVAVTDPLEPARFFDNPTPGEINGVGIAGFAEEPEFSVPGGIFTSGLALALTSATPGATIRYTLDGSVPTETDGVDYTGPIPITDTELVRARAIGAELAESQVASEAYIFLAPDVEGFDSDLPLVVVENFGAGVVPKTTMQTAYVAVFEPNGGRTRLTDGHTLLTRAGVKVRGSSTQWDPKGSYAVETRDEYDEDLDVAPLGMPAESDWILYAPYRWDRTLIRNAFMYALSNQVGRYAVLTRFVEVFVNIDGGALTADDYAGLYVFMEKIKRGPDRVDVMEITPAHNQEPEITGGWMLKIDRLDPGDVGFSIAGLRIGYVDPKEVEVNAEQASWIFDHFSAFRSSLAEPDPDEGYAQFIDVDAWIDHHILNVLAQNVDGLRLSTYMFKQREGPITMGPIWDFDRSMDSYDSRDNDPTSWNGAGTATDFFQYPWWKELFEHADFWQAWIDRWTELRTGAFTLENIHGTIDQMAAEINEAQLRNFAKWTAYPPAGGDWNNEIANMKAWLAERVDWIDAQFQPAPRFDRPVGQVTSGTQLTIWAPEGSVFYTFNGDDPRAPGGTIAAGAIRADEPITITQTIYIRARTLGAQGWSAPTAGAFSVDAANIVINELMYEPPPGESEFVELYNPSEVLAVDLSGWRLQGAGYTFPAGTVLAPRHYLLVVEDLAAFAATFGTDLPVVGEFPGSLADDGETLLLLDAFDREVDVVSYERVPPWPPSAAGGGFTLELIDAARDNDRVGNWVESLMPGGTPGAVNGSAAALAAFPAIFLNEATPNNVAGLPDEHGEFEPWLELFNAGPTTVDLGGYTLSDDYGGATQWSIPPDTALCSGQWLLFWADAEPGDGALHTDFELSQYGGALALYHADGRLLGYLNYPAAAAGMSYGRFPDGGTTRHVLPAPTPQTANVAGISPLILNEYNAVSDSKYLKNGASDTYWGRVLGNGGDWFELVVTQDHLDIRGWSLIVSDNTGGGGAPQTLVLSTDPLWADLRSGTIITVSELLADDVGLDLQQGDWWINVQAGAVASGLYITAEDFSVSNVRWQLTVQDATSQVVFGPAGEGIEPVSGIGSDEVFKLEEDPSPFVHPHSDYNDGSSSTFGAPNVFAGGTQAQDFTLLRDVLQPCASDAACDDDDPCTVDTCTNGFCANVPSHPCYELRVRCADATSNGALMVCGDTTFTVTVDADGLREAVNGLQVLIEYDPSLLRLESLDAGDGAGSPWDEAIVIVDDAGDDGAVAFVVLLVGSETDEAGPIATLEFSALDVSGQTSPAFQQQCPPRISSLTRAADNQRITPVLVDGAAVLITPSSCDDGDACTVEDACSNGACLGTPTDCAYLDDDCNVGECVASTGLCVAVPANDGGACDDDDPCTADDACASGLCAGWFQDCDTDGLCDAVDNCVAVPNPLQIDVDSDGFGDACDGPFDSDHDGDVDLSDFLSFATCFSGPVAPGTSACRDIHDVDADGDIDLLDYAALQALFTGAWSCDCCA